MPTQDQSSGHVSSSATLRSLLPAIWSKARRWLAYIAVLFGLASPFLPEKWRYVALTVLLGVIAQALFEVQRTLTSPPTRPHVRTVENVIAAEAEMSRCLQECLDHNLPIRIQWIGMTMYNAWNSLNNVLDRLAQRRARNVSVEIAMLTEDWLDQNPINPEWDRVQAEGTATRIQLYLATNHVKLAGLNWKIVVYRYAHMPILHGGLISDRCLFLAFSRWDDGCLKAGVKSYEVHRNEDGNYAQDRIDVYRNWFAFCTTKKEDWYGHNLNLRQRRLVAADEPK